MRTGDRVLWLGCEFTIITELDDEYVYLAAGNDSAQLVHVSDLEVVQ